MMYTLDLCLPNDRYQKYLTQCGILGMASKSGKIFHLYNGLIELFNHPPIFSLFTNVEMNYYLTIKGYNQWITVCPIYTF